MDFSTAEELSDFKLIPGGTIVKARIQEAEYRISNAGNGFANTKFTVEEGEYAGSNLIDAIGLDGNEDFVRMGHGKIKRILECTTGASEQNKSGYIIPEKTGPDGKLAVQWNKELPGMWVYLRVKIEPYRNKEGVWRHGNKIDTYGSTNPASKGYPIAEAYKNGQQPWQKNELPPLPAGGGGGASKATYGAMQPSPPIEAYNDGAF